MRGEEGGIRGRSEGDLVVGGRVAPPGRFPYVVSLQREEHYEYHDYQGNDDDVDDVGGVSAGSGHDATISSIPYHQWTE
jgi:hypothetical protein